MTVEEVVVACAVGVVVLLTPTVVEEVVPEVVLVPAADAALVAIVNAAHHINRAIAVKLVPTATIQHQRVVARL